MAVAFRRMQDCRARQTPAVLVHENYDRKRDGARSAGDISTLPRDATYFRRAPKTVLLHAKILISVLALGFRVQGLWSLLNALRRCVLKLYTLTLDPKPYTQQHPKP